MRHGASGKSIYYILLSYARLKSGKKSGHKTKSSSSSITNLHYVSGPAWVFPRAFQKFHKQKQINPLQERGYGQYCIYENTYGPAYGRWETAIQNLEEETQPSTSVLWFHR